MSVLMVDTFGFVDSCAELVLLSVLQSMFTVAPSAMADAVRLAGCQYRKYILSNLSTAAREALLVATNWWYSPYCQWLAPQWLPQQDCNM